MLPTEQLKNEHQAIKLMLEILEAVSGKIDAGERVNEDDLKDMVEFISVFADKCHHGKEEDLLFPAMEEAGIPKEDGPIGVMIDEHNLGRSYVKAMREAKDQKDFAAAAKNYVSLLTQHIDKEDNILYQIADMHLSKEKQNELLDQFEKVEKEKIGHGKHEEFHQMLEKLKNIYS
ncbi:MAG: hemerythrin domain-containing protein [bacterium]|nr:hemerythrin domain-containing protein [bacterium]